MLVPLQNLRGGRAGDTEAGEGEMGMLIKSFTASEADAGSRPQLGLSLAV